MTFFSHSRGFASYDTFLVPIRIRINFLARYTVTKTETFPSRPCWPHRTPLAGGQRTPGYAKRLSFCKYSKGRQSFPSSAFFRVLQSQIWRNEHRELGDEGLHQSRLWTTNSDRFFATTWNYRTVEFSYSKQQTWTTVKRNDAVLSWFVYGPRKRCGSEASQQL